MSSAGFVYVYMYTPAYLILVTMCVSLFNSGAIQATEASALVQILWCTHIGMQPNMHTGKTLEGALSYKQFELRSVT